MSFTQELSAFSEKISKNFTSLKSHLKTEEATKQSLIIPFIKILGYDVYDPFEVIPEYVCDIGTKKWEKIDYAIIRDNEPIILIEAKQCEQNLSLHDNQLLRYFHTSKAKFWILTNGIEYRFYTDLEEPNKMDEHPFLEINLLHIKTQQIDELAKFQKTAFDIDAITSSASELKYTTALRNLIQSEFQNPSLDLVRHFTKQIYSGRITDKVCDQFTQLIKKSFSDMIRSLVSDRLSSALKSENQEKNPSQIQKTPPWVVYISEDGKIQTTQLELDAFNIVKAIVHEVVDISRISYRDGQQYFSILLDNSSRKCFLRLYFNSKTTKYITIFDEKKNFVRYDISSPWDIYTFSASIKKALGYIENTIPRISETPAVSTGVPESIDNKHVVNIFQAADPTGKKITYIVWNGEGKEVRSLSDVYVFCMQTLFANQKDRFLQNDIVLLLKISSNSSTLRQPSPLGNGYFFEAHLSSIDKFNRIKKVLELCHMEDALLISYAP